MNQRNISDKKHKKVWETNWENYNQEWNVWYEIFKNLIEGLNIRINQFEKKIEPLDKIKWTFRK